MDPAPRIVHSVTELAGLLRALIEESLPRVWVEGEISNFSRPASGHWYFTLKDTAAQLRCAMFRNQNLYVRPQPRDGDRVLIRAELSFYTARGDLQLICEHLEPAGQGDLLRAFEQLKKRLAAEGLFDVAAKRPVPALPRMIGLITSATGAAVQDVTAALARRFPLIPVVLWPVPVQGAAAAPAIVGALRELPRRAPVDVILLVRGGGSLEDLWAFNEEAVARAIRACGVPVVCGIGHEVDFSIADFAADLRAPTPTAAAEMVSPDRAVILQRLAALHAAAQRAQKRVLVDRRAQMERALARLLRLHPQRVLRDRAQQLDGLQQRLHQSALRQLRLQAQRGDALGQRLIAQHPLARLTLERTRLAARSDQLGRNLAGFLRLRVERHAHHAARLHSVSPQAVLHRGYAIAQHQGRVIRSADELSPADEFELILSRGQLRARRSG